MTGGWDALVKQKFFLLLCLQEDGDLYGPLLDNWEGKGLGTGAVQGRGNVAQASTTYVSQMKSTASAGASVSTVHLPNGNS